MAGPLSLLLVDLLDDLYHATGSVLRSERSVFMNTRYFTVEGTLVLNSDGTVSLISGTCTEVFPTAIPPAVVVPVQSAGS